MADILQIVCVKVIHKLIPPVFVMFLSTLPVLDLELAELDCQVHDGNGYDLRLPTEAQRGPQTVVDEGPRHLHNLLKLLRLP